MKIYRLISVGRQRSSVFPVPVHSCVSESQHTTTQDMNTACRSCHQSAQLCSRKPEDWAMSSLNPIHVFLTVFAEVQLRVSFL